MRVETHRVPMPALLSLATCLLASLEAPEVVPVTLLASLFDMGRGKTRKDCARRRHTLDLVRDVVGGVLDGVHF